ncbi:sensor histidine kinase [Spirosoma sordidisoli]|uniref:Histidine kinase n=1 Tax=Spirosoma sordidisoli TaxID=2502893 RepID=A0A4Q2UY24_9BACT|nr:histidine kinase [Spirosoma sordidisoli]RYC71979.1 histidine kinase [Spirosoma sordidisoli]
MDFLDRRITIPLTTRTTTVKYALVHTAYWVLITGFFLYEKRYLIYKAGLPYFVACVVVRVVLLIAIAYLNIHYLLPRYLLAGRYVRYFSLVLLAILGYLLVQAFYDYILYGYVIAPTRSRDWLETLSYNFFSTLWYLGLMVPLKLSIDWYQQQRVLQQITVEKLQAEVNFLRAQINPHFLFNVMNSLYALTLKKSDLAPEMVLKLSDMMEYMLYDSDELTVPLERELKYIQTYIDLEKIRCGGEADVALRIDGHPNGQEIAPLLLLPLVENAFKHGVSRQAGKAWLHSTVTLNPTTVEITVENNKPAVYTGTQPAETRGGFGLANLRKRLELLYPGRYTLRTEEGSDTYKAALFISFTNH